MTAATLAEICAVACAEAFRGDGEILASPIGVIPGIGARLARATFAPDLLLTDGVASLVTGVGPAVAQATTSLASSRGGCLIGPSSISSGPAAAT